MTDGRHIGDDAAGVAALRHDDPVRMAAVAHARACPGCARSLEQAERMLALLDGHPGNADAPPASLRAASRAVLGRLGAMVVPTRFVAVLLVSVWVILVALARHRAAGIGSWVQSGALVAASLISLSLMRVLGAGAAGLALAASVLITAGAWGPGPLEARHGMACVLTELVVASSATALTAWIAVRRRSRHPSTALVGTAVAGALTGQAALHLTCPGGVAGPHLLAFHFGGVVVAALLAAIVGRLMAHDPLPEHHRVSGGR